MRLINADVLKSDLVQIVRNGEKTYEAVIFPWEIRNAETIDPYARVLEIIDKADKEAVDKTYIVLDDGFFCSQAMKFGRQLKHYEVNRNEDSN